MLQLSESESDRLEQLLSQIADLAGSQGISEIESLTEAALMILEQAKLAEIRHDRASES